MSTVYRIQCKKNWYHATFPSRWVWQSGSVVPMMIFQPSFFTLKALNWFEGRLSWWIWWHPRVVSSQNSLSHSQPMRVKQPLPTNSQASCCAQTPGRELPRCHRPIPGCTSACVGWPSYIHLYNSPSTFSHKWLHSKTCFLQPNDQTIKKSKTLNFATYHPIPYNPIHQFESILNTGRMMVSSCHPHRPWRLHRKYHKDMVLGCSWDSNAPVVQVWRRETC